MPKIYKPGFKLMCYSLFFMQKYLLALWTTILLNAVTILTTIYFVIRDDRNYTCQSETDGVQHLSNSAQRNCFTLREHHYAI